MTALTFPTDLTDRYYFDLKFKTYSRPSPFTGKINLGEPASFLGLGGASVGSGNIRLPVPSNIVDTQRLNWQQAENIDGAIGAVSSMAEEMMGRGTGDGGAGLGNVVAGLGGGISKILQSTAMGTTGDAAALLLQKSGLALNPVLTQLFKHPEFKQHQFSWVLAPENSNESYALQTIIDHIKTQSLPDIVAGGAFFSYPSIAMIQIHTGNNGNLYNFQPCVITQVSVNYAPRGVPSFFAGTNAPTMVSLDIAFLEIILNTRSNTNGQNVSGFDFSLGSLGSNTMKEKAMNVIRDVLK